jgi:hypothetical protein
LVPRSLRLYSQDVVLYVKIDRVLLDTREVELHDQLIPVAVSVHRHASLSSSARDPLNGAITLGQGLNCDDHSTPPHSAQLLPVQH